MAYQALYNKYRPQTFDEVVGQKAVTSTLKNAIKEDKISHAYLFCGPRGTGKTTMARLFAKALNCSEGIGHQCNNCDSCKAIMRGDHPDVIEIDAASNSSVESARQLIETISYQPIMSPFKIYIIDEVHSMSPAAFNALLKTLEEPPSFVVFILATTEPQKVLPTILSRVQRFDFSKVSRTDLISNMKRILKSENISYEEEALNLIASLSDGGVRDSLSLLDQAVSYCGESLRIEDVNSLFGLLSTEEELKLISMISNGDAKECLSLVKSRYEHGADIVRLHSDLITIYKDLLIYQTTKDESLLEKLNTKEASSYSESLSSLNEKIEYLITSKREYRTADNFLSHFELTLLHLMPSSSSSSLSTTPIPTQQKIVEAKKEQVVEEKKEENLVEYDSKPELIEKKDGNFGFVATPPVVEESDERIGYTEDELINLMTQPQVSERAKLRNGWAKLSKLHSTDKGFESRALSSCNLVLCACDILVVECSSISEISKINTKNAQPTLVSICEDVFGKKYHVLPITVNEFRSAFGKFKETKDTLSSHEPNIDFGEEKHVEDSTSFLNELLGN